MITEYKPNNYLKTNDPNFIPILKDALAGDPDALQKAEIKSLNLNNIKAAIEWLSKQEDAISQDIKARLATEGWRLTYYRKPPTPKEFLEYEWIGPQSESLWPHVEKAFLEYMDPNPLNPSRGLALSTSIGWGKANPVDANIAIDKTITLELEDEVVLQIPADEVIEIIEQGKSVKIRANELLKKDLNSIDLPQRFCKGEGCMKIKSISYNYVYKKMGDIQVGDKVLGPSGEKFTVLETTDHGLQDVYKIILSDGRSFESMGSHLSTVHFRNSHVRPDKKVYDTVTTDFIKDHIQEYVFEIPTDDTFSWTELDCPQLIEMLPLHEYEPIDKQHIIPDLNKNPKKVYIERIEKLEKQKECRCIALNYPWGLYVIEHGILTHNSLLSNICLAYEIVLFGLMRQPYRILGHSPMTSYSVALCSFTQNKAWDVLGTPFEQFLEQSPYFEKVGRHDDITAINKEDEECKKCYYTTAARGSSKMLFRNNLSMSIVSTEGGLLGKAQPLYSKVMLPDGTYKTMGEIKLGDKIASPTEGETEVVGVFPQGKRRIYEIELEDGKKTRASDNHLWKVAIDKKEDQSWNWQIVDTLQLIQWLEAGVEIEMYGEDNDINCHIPKH